MWFFFIHFTFSLSERARTSHTHTCTSYTSISFWWRDRWRIILSNGFMYYHSENHTLHCIGPTERNLVNDVGVASEQNVRHECKNPLSERMQCIWCGCVTMQMQMDVSKKWQCAACGIRNMFIGHAMNSNDLNCGGHSHSLQIRYIL